MCPEYTPSTIRCPPDDGAYGSVRTGAQDTSRDVDRWSGHFGRHRRVRVCSVDRSGFGTRLGGVLLHGPTMSAETGKGMCNLVQDLPGNGTQSGRSGL